YREDGYLPEALINFLALLGWNPGDDREILSLDELTSLFDLDGCSKSGAKFDYKKAVWFNHQYIQQKSDEEIARLFIPVMEKNLNLVFSNETVKENVERKEVVLNVDCSQEDFEAIVKIVGLVKERVNFVDELWEQAGFFFISPSSYDEKTVKKRWKEDSGEKMQELISLLQKVDDFSAHSTEQAVMSWIELNGYHSGNIMNAIRLALVGESKGPHIFDIIEILGKENVVRRLENAIGKLIMNNY
ncbi:MAG: hypothetical protein LBT24_01085, partial [Tannerella sp.]|nr:hypothetical protein [Tannerella sp.]